MMDFVVAAGILVVALMTYFWVVGIRLRESKSDILGAAWWGLLLLAAWGSIILGVMERIRTGRYPVALLKLFGFEVQ
jgi:hypothetical protein